MDWNEFVSQFFEYYKKGLIEPVKALDDTMLLDKVARFSKILDKFINNVNLIYEQSMERVNTAAVAKNEDKGVNLYLNEYFFGYILNFSILNDIISIEEAYEFAIGILYHEMLHVLLKHIDKRRINVDNHQMFNVACDIIVDNIVKKDLSSWRNWQEMVEKIGLSVNKEDKNYVLHFTEEDVYLLLMSNDIKEEDLPPLTDVHDIQQEDKKGENKGDNQSNNSEKGDQSEDQQEGGNSQEDNKDKSGKNGSDEKDKGKQNDNKGNKDDKNEEDSECDMGNKKGKNPKQKGKGQNIDKEQLDRNINNIINKIRNGDFKKESNNKANDKFDELIAEISNTGKSYSSADKTSKRIIEGYRYNYLNLLRKYFTKITYKTRKTTWKKYNRKLPGLLPGSKPVKKPGTILIALDISGSMREWINNYLDKVLGDIYAAFSYISHIYSMPSEMHFAQIDDKIVKIDRIANLDDFMRDFEIISGGGTDYKPFFDNILETWNRKVPGQRIPDLILIITDEEFEYEFLNNPQYKVFENHLIWLTTRSFEMSNTKFPVGETIALRKLGL